MEVEMKNTVYITGHRNPDSDSICAALAYAEYKNKTDANHYVPVRLGEINRETYFILAYFGVEQPQFIENVRLQVSDLNIDKIAPISSDITLKMAWNIMKMNNIKQIIIITFLSAITFNLSVAQTGKVHSNGITIAYEAFGNKDNEAII